MKKIEIEEVGNGYIVEIQGTSGSNGVHVYRLLDEYPLLELIGKVLTDFKVKVERK
jgi:hypothetical protein